MPRIGSCELRGHQVSRPHGNRPVISQSLQWRFRGCMCYGSYKLYNCPMSPKVNVWVCFPCRFEVDLVPTGSPRTYRFQLRSEEPDSLSGLAWQYTTLMGTLLWQGYSVEETTWDVREAGHAYHDTPCSNATPSNFARLPCLQTAGSHGGSMSMWFASFYAAIPVHLSSHCMIFCRFRMSQCPSCRGRAGGFLFCSVEGFGLFRVV